MSLAVDWAAYVVVRLLVAFVQTLPVDAGNRMCFGLGWFCCRVLKLRRRATHTNLRQIFPEATIQQHAALEMAMWHHLLLMVCEIAWAQRRLHRCNWSQSVRFYGSRTMLKHLLSERPTVIVTGHFGNFEIGGYLIGMLGVSTTTIARKLDNVFLDRWVKRFRSAKGQQMVDKEGCAAEIETHLEGGGTLSILADQHAGDKGCWVDFMGVPASCHKALALFSLSSGAPMIVSYTCRDRDQPMKFVSGCVGVADPSDDDQGVCGGVRPLTNWYNEQLTQAVAVAPPQYWWLHRRWRTPPPKVAKRLAKYAA
ncbi:MAG: lipid A biosynthesis acyltransferase [Planctomycetota bacterium]